MGKVNLHRSRRGFGRLRELAILTCVWWSLYAHAGPQGAEAPLEYQVKAAFLMNFTKFVEWPSSEPPDSPIAICILGKDPFGHTMDQVVDGESISSRRLVVERVSQLPAPPSCKVVFVGLPEKEVPKTLSSLGPGILTVGDGERFVKAGGMIGFVVADRHVRFDINQTAAANAGLKLSSKLLNVAKSIEK
jgi:hypothetical protein